MIKGNDKDCICEKPKRKHRKNCDAYRLAEFFKKCGFAGLEKVLKQIKN